MKNRRLIMLAVLVVISLNSGCSSKTTVESDTQKAKYKDGTYEVKTNADGEGFHSEAKVNISKSKISDVQWKIIDGNGRIFDNKYEEVYPNSELYRQQSRDDYKGAITYGPKLIETQDIGKVDAISGATWSNSKFKEVVSMALEEAEK